MVFVSIANYMNVLGYESHTNVDMNRFLYLPTKKKKTIPAQTNVFWPLVVTKNERYEEQSKKNEMSKVNTI